MRPLREARRNARAIEAPFQRLPLTGDALDQLEAALSAIGVRKRGEKTRLAVDPSS